MTTVPPTVWRFLVVEDDAQIAAQVVEALPLFVQAPDSAEGESVQSFVEAARVLVNRRFDVLILDLKDDSVPGATEDDASAGLKILEQLKATRFSPVVFYTAHPHKVREMQNPFIRVVEKTEGLERLREEVTNVFATRLPALARQIEEIQRHYLWDFVGAHWPQLSTPTVQVDLTYMLARRLAWSLQRQARALAPSADGAGLLPAESDTVHPMEVYVHPIPDGQRRAGDILRGSVGGQDGLWIVLTPNCDFARKKKHLDFVLLARCLPLKEEREFTDWHTEGAHEEALRSLIGDNRAKRQPERYKFLPGTFFIPDSIVDFQRLAVTPVAELENLQAVASLDSPFAEALLARFTRYFGRLGTPDIDKDVVLTRLKADA